MMLDRIQQARLGGENGGQGHQQQAQQGQGVVTQDKKTLADVAGDDGAGFCPGMEDPRQSGAVQHGWPFRVNP
jgi:hypothetical protein